MDRDEIMEQIRKRAASYVPEWRFDAEFPDIGTALAMVYGDMFSGTVNRFDRIFLKNRIAFLNELDAKLLPARPAEGYVTFGLVNDEVQGVELPTGTVVNCREGDGEGDLHYRTQDDLYISPASVDSIYFTSDREDFISRLYAGGEMGETPLFDPAGPNLQEHVLYLGHREAFYIKNEGWIQLDFLLRGGARVSGRILEQLADPDCARFSYYSEEGWVEFERPALENENLCLRKGKGQPAFAWTGREGEEGYYIRCCVSSMGELEKLYLSGIDIRTWGRELPPDCVYANGVESGRRDYFPFGERLTPFAEAYFGCEEALCKRGALITLAFHLDFVRIPLDYNMENDPVKWEWIMKRSDFRADPEYDVTVASVIWEYYNGIGWARLFQDDRFSTLFFPGSSQRVYRKVEFLCPGDIQPLTVNSCRSWYIRARVLKVNNLYKMKGSYVSPVMDNTVFSYDYEGHKTRAHVAAAYNCLEERRLVFPEKPFARMGVKEDALFMGFGRALCRSPVRMLFRFREEKERREDSFLWEYFDGFSWRELSVMDETRNFARSGLVTIMAPGEMLPLRLFGEERYWIRIRGMDGRHGRQARESTLPVLLGIHMNTVRIVGVDRWDTEYFRMEAFQENMVFRLMHRKVIQARVYVNEAEDLDGSQLEGLAAEDRVRPVYDEAGILREAWVQWIPREDFSQSGENDRHYVLDRNEGIILFGNSRRGRIPPAAGRDNIRVEYSSGGGERTNLPAGAVNQLDQDAGFINKVSNPLPLRGGCDVETLDAAVRRCSGMLRHQNRAVTARDYEELVEASSRDILKARCFPGWDGEGRRRPGAVTVVILRRSQGMEFERIRYETERYLEERTEEGLLSSGRFFLMEPEFVELSVRVRVTVRDLNGIFRVKREILSRLERFLDPVGGNFKGQGWEIGRLPGSIQIKNAIADTPGLVFVKGIYITAYAGGALGRREVDLERMGGRKYVLPVSGIHEVLAETQ